MSERLSDSPVESLYETREEAVSAALFECRCDGDCLNIHAATCDGSDDCGCIVYRVSPDDPREAAEILAAADALQAAQ